MRPDRHHSKQASLHADGRLDPDAADAFEREVEGNPRARAERDRIEGVRSLLRALPPLPENPRFSEHLARRLTAEETRAPRLFPRWSVPAYAGMLAVVAVTALLFIITWDRPIDTYIKNARKQVQQAYAENILTSWMMPLFQKTDNDEVLQFAMYGTLPLDTIGGAMLHVDNTAAQGYRLELGKTTARARPAPKIADLYREVRATREQQRAIDSVLFAAQRQIESSVLIGNDRAIAISPTLSDLNRVILAGVASALDPQQRVRLERYLNDRDAPYAVAMAPAPQWHSSERILEQLRMPQGQRQFVVLRNDSVGAAPITLDVTDLQRRMAEAVHAPMPPIAPSIEALAKRYSSLRRTGAGVQEPSDERESHDLISIQLDAPRARAVHEYLIRVRPRMLRRELERGTGMPDIRIRMLADSLEQFQLRIDSVMERALERIPDFDMHIDMPEANPHLVPAVPPRPPRSPGRADTVIIRRSRKSMSDESSGIRMFLLPRRPTEQLDNQPDLPPLRDDAGGAFFFRYFTDEPVRDSMRAAQRKQLGPGKLPTPGQRRVIDTLTI